MLEITHFGLLGVTAVFVAASFRRLGPPANLAMLATLFLSATIVLMPMRWLSAAISAARRWFSQRSAPLKPRSRLMPMRRISPSSTCTNFWRSKSVRSSS